LEFALGRISISTDIPVAGFEILKGGRMIQGEAGITLVPKGSRMLKQAGLEPMGQGRRYPCGPRIF